MSVEKTLVIISDIHSGSRSAVAVPNFEMEDGARLHLNKSQGALYECWKSLAEDWQAPDILVVNGDAIEGQARKESGVPVWSTNMDDQLNNAETLIRMFNAKETYIIDGTGYHVDAGGKSLENWLAIQLDSKKCGFGRKRSGDELFLRILNTTFHFAHHIQVGTGWYRGTPLAREAVFALLNESHKHKVDVIIRSHVHTFFGIEATRQQAFTTPCWQLQTRFQFKKSALGMVPDIGALRFRITEKGYAKDKRFFRPEEVRPKLYTIG